MEVDMQSPSRRSSRSCSTKRPRSPNSPSPINRASKRPFSTLTTSASSPAAVFLDGSRCRLGSVDWVKQTGELTIESPSLCSASGESLILDPGPNGGHGVNMSIYLDSSRTDANDDLQARIPTAQSDAGTSVASRYDEYNHVEQFQQDQEGSTSSFVSPDQTLDNALGLQLQCAHSNIIPPPSSSEQPPYPSPAPTRPPSPMPLTPPTSWTAPNPARRLPRAVTMGPRADCEKCRLGVSGHWMHF